MLRDLDAENMITDDVDASYKKFSNYVLHAADNSIPKFI